jgi:DNA-binding NtrC family response regulator
VAAAGEAEAALGLLRERPFDLVITDLRLPGMNGMKLLETIHELYPGTGVVLITAYPEVELAVQAIKAGAFDFLCKPFPRDGLLLLVERFFRFLDLKRENARLRGEREDGEFIGESPAMLRVFERIRALADACVPVLVRGPSGSGKELVAGALHRLSGRSAKPFIKINCAALPEQLLESELFGHERGAFTGPSRRASASSKPRRRHTVLRRGGEMPLTCKPSCCACSRTRRSPPWAATRRAGSTSAPCSPRRATWMRPSPRANSVRISITASTWCP